MRVVKGTRDYGTPSDNAEKGMAGRTLLLNEDARDSSPRGARNLQYTQTNPY